MNRDYGDLFAEFNAQKVEFLIVGAYALAVHGHVRATKDLDVWIRPTPDNADPAASLTFDKFHLTKIIGDAVDKTRREERSEHPELKGQRYALLRNPDTMSDAQLDFVSDLLLRKTNLKTARAFHLKLAFQDFYHQPRLAAEAYLKKWCSWATRSRVPAMVAAARTIRNHWHGVLRWFTSKITNGLLEGINSLIQAAKAKARGYRTSRNLIAMVYLVAGKLELNLSHL